MLKTIHKISKRNYPFSVASVSKWDQDVNTFKNIENYGEEPSFLDQVNYQVDKAAKYTNVMPELLEFIKACDSTIKFNLPLKRDDGSLETVT